MAAYASSVSTDVPPGLNQPPAPQIMTQPLRLVVVEPGKGTRLKVQAIGNGLTYEWFKKLEDEPSSLETPEQRVFREHTVDFERLVNANDLYPSLHNAYIITTAEVEDLGQEVIGNTNDRKVKRLLQILPKSSTHFLGKLITCLRSTEHRGHLELADIYESALWTPLASYHCRYDGVDNSTLILCSVKKAHEGVYRCRVSSRDRVSVLSDPAQVSLIKPDDEAVQAFVDDLQVSPENGAELAQTLVSRLQKGSMVGYVALWEAVTKCGECTEVVRTFTANGWSPSTRQEGGRTLVHLLSEKGHTDTLEMILQQSSQEEAVRAADENRHTPLHLAVQGGHVDTVCVLLKVEAARSTVDYQDKDFNTALHMAVETGSVAMVQALLTTPSINLGILNKDNLKAIDVARKMEQNAIVALLQEKERQQIPLSPLSNGAAILEKRSNSYDCIIVRSESEASWLTSGYASSAGGSHNRMSRSESMEALTTADRGMLQLQRRLLNYRGTLTGKKLLKEGVLKKVNRRGVPKDCTLFVLSDVMLYTKYNEILRKYSVSGELSVRGMEVLDTEDSDRPAVRDQPLSFTVTSKERALHLVASSQEDKEDWIECLKCAIRSLRLSPGHQSSPQLPAGAGLGARAPVWVPDTHVTACQLSNCSKKFSFLERKHHCRQCGKVVCGSCSTERKYMAYKKREERVCDECVKAFSGHQSVDADTDPQQENGKGVVMSGYALRLQSCRKEKKWYCLKDDDVLYIYGAHEDTKPSNRIIVKMGYTVQGDMGSCKLSLTHPSAREELNESFMVPVDMYNKWYEALKSVKNTTSQ